jgi:hypothetical protein
VFEEIGKGCDNPDSLEEDALAQNDKLLNCNSFFTTEKRSTLRSTEKFFTTKAKLKYYKLIDPGLVLDVHRQVFDKLRLTSHAYNILVFLSVLRDFVVKKLAPNHFLNLIQFHQSFNRC